MSSVMRKGVLAFAALASLAAGCGGVPESIMGAQAAAVGAEAAIQGAGAAIRSLAASFTTQNQLSWGNPRAIVVRDEAYYVVYPTPESEMRAGRPRVLIIRRNDGSIRRAIPGEPLAAVQAGSTFAGSSQF
jgi:hypothetical protein